MRSHTRPRRTTTRRLGGGALAVAVVVGLSPAVASPARADAMVHLSGVVRSGGVVVAGAVVSFGDAIGGSASTTTTADGSYDLDVSSGSGTIAVGFDDLSMWGDGDRSSAIAPWGLSSSAPLDVGATDLAGVDLTLPTWHALTIHVRDHADQPVAGALINQPLDAPQPTCTTPLIDGAEAQCSWNVLGYFVQNGGYGNTGFMSGAIADDSGTLRIPQVDSVDATGGEPGFSPAGYTLGATDPADHTLTGSAATGALSDDTSLTITLPQKVDVTGTVVTDGGTPVAHATVAMRNRVGVANQYVTSDAHGGFTATTSPGAGGIAVFGYDPTFPHGMQTVGLPEIVEGGSASQPSTPALPWGLLLGSPVTIPPDGAQLGLQVPATHLLTVHVRSSAGDPVAGASVSSPGAQARCSTRLLIDDVTSEPNCVWQIAGDSSPDPSSSTDASGDVRIPQVASPQWQYPYPLDFTATTGNGFAATASLTELLDDATLTLTLPDPVTISGTVRVADTSTVVPGLVVGYRGPGASTSIVTTTSEQGTFTLAVPSGAGSVGIRTYDPTVTGGVQDAWGWWITDPTLNVVQTDPALPYGYSVTQDLTVPEAGLDGLDLDVPPTHMVAVRVVDSHGQPIAGVPLQCQPDTVGSNFPLIRGTDPALQMGSSSAPACHLGMTSEDPSTAVTSSDGRATLPLIDAEHNSWDPASPVLYSFSAVDPSNHARDGSATLDEPLTADAAVDITFPDAPAKPASLAVHTSTSSLSVVWTAPTDDGLRPVLDYVVDAVPLSAAPRAAMTSETVASAPVIHHVVDAAVLSDVLPEALPGVRYDVTVRAENAVGIGAAQEIAVTMPSATPVLVSLSSSSGPAFGAGRITLHGTGFTSGAIVTFGGVRATRLALLGSTALTVTVPAHAPGRVDVTVTTSAGSSTRRAAFTYRPSAPSAPRAIRLAVSGRHVTVSWTTPATNGGRSILGVKVVVYPGLRACMTSVRTSCTVWHLHRGVTYRLRIVARNGLGYGPAAYSVTFRV